MESDGEVFEIMENLCAEQSEQNEVNENENDVSTPPPKKKKKPSVTSTWTNSVINDLINAVEEHPCIWEYSSVEYKDRSKREQAWRQISEKCSGHAVEDCKAKWANIKTAFLNIKRKINTTKSGQAAANIQPHWLHWNAMQFYHTYDSDKTRSSVSTMENDSPPSTTSCSVSSAKSTKELEDESSKTDRLMERAAKFLEADEEDNWHVFGMYLASQLRELAKSNIKAANKLHLNLLKSAMEAISESQDDN